MSRCGRFVSALLFALCLAPAAQAQHAVIVNGVALDRQTVTLLERTYRTPIRPGRYWYDRVSGLWGLERGPAIGQILAGLKLGGPLRADASGGGTRVFFNGRELHPSEVAYLRRLAGVVLPGRYWVDAAGVGGYENGPPFFNLRALADRQSGGGRAWSHAGPGGYMGSDGRCTYYNDPQTGSSVMTGSC